MHGASAAPFHQNLSAMYEPRRSATPMTALKGKAMFQKEEKRGGSVVLVVIEIDRHP